MVRLSNLAALALVPLSLAAPLPRFMQPQALPAKRLITNLAALLEKQPKNHDLLYKMARLHYLALANQSVLVPAWDFGQRGPQPAPDHLARGFVRSLRYAEATRLARKALEFDTKTKMDRARWKALNKVRKAKMKQLEAAGWRPEAPSMQQLHRHAEQAMVHFDKAIELAPKNALYHLGRASLGEQCLDLELAGKLPRRAVSKPLEKLSHAVVRDQYLATFDLVHKREIESGSIPAEGIEGLVSHEAGKAYLRLTKKDAKLRAGQDAAIARVQKGLRALGKLKRGPITPILIADRADDELSDLLAPHTSVVFDLDGDGTREAWPWVRRTTGILAWDPLGRGDIDSGRQLFGSVTWNLFHRDGYAALQLLDDDADGRLTGLELDGLVIWRDRDGDGVAHAREVLPLWRAGIRSLSTYGAVDTTGVLGNRDGVRYGDGRVLPSFDWVTRAR